MLFHSNCPRAVIFVCGLSVLLVESFRHFDVGGEEVKAQVIEKDEGVSRQRRSEDGFPGAMDVNIKADGIDINFSLHRNYDVTDDVPVLLMRRSKIVKYRFDSDEPTAYYFDKESGTSMMAWRKEKTTDVNNHYNLFGTFTSGNEDFLLQPPEQNSYQHTVAKITEDNPIFTDITPNPDFNLTALREKYERRNTTHNRKRRADINYEVEVLFVLDYGLYQTWYANTVGETDRASTTIQDMKQFYAFILNAMNVKYQSVTGLGYTISCLCAGVYIADTPSAAPFVEDNVRGSGSGRYFDGYVVRDEFRNWSETNLAPQQGYDHGMLFTGYDIYGASSSVVGISYIGGLCAFSKYSINEGQFKATIATVAAHELGHNLGAYHDGTEGNECFASDRFIMAATYSVSDDVPINHRLWIFSNCSLLYFDMYIYNLMISNNNCMLTRDAADTSALEAYSSDLAGQIYTPDMQCERGQGAGSFLYRDYYDEDYSTICRLMACSDDTHADGYANHIAWEGTSCGNGKICKGGSCVSSSSAPNFTDEACMFGDVPYNFQSATCSETLGSNETVYLCYNSTYRESCCETCGKHKKENAGIIGCEYGDHYPICSTIDIRSCYNLEDHCCISCPARALPNTDCKYGDKAISCDNMALSDCYFYENTCCQSCPQRALSIENCEYGDKADWCDRLSLSDCYDNDAVCCQFCYERVSPVEGCKYGDKDVACAMLPLSGCYDYEEVCCQSCPAKALSIEGCKYGDKRTGCNRNLCPSYDAYELQQCCQTCAPETTVHTSPSPQVTTSLSTFTSVVIPYNTTTPISTVNTTNLKVSSTLSPTNNRNSSSSSSLDTTHSISTATETINDSVAWPYNGTSTVLTTTSSDIFRTTITFPEIYTSSTITTTPNTNTTTSTTPYTPSASTTQPSPDTTSKSKTSFQSLTKVTEAPDTTSLTTKLTTQKTPTVTFYTTPDRTSTVEMTQEITYSSTTDPEATSTTTSDNMPPSSTTPNTTFSTTTMNMSSITYPNTASTSTRSTTSTTIPENTLSTTPETTAEKTTHTSTTYPTTLDSETSSETTLDSTLPFSTVHQNSAFSSTSTLTAPSTITLDNTIALTSKSEGTFKTTHETTISTFIATSEITTTTEPSTSTEFTSISSSTPYTTLTSFTTSDSMFTAQTSLNTADSTRSTTETVITTTETPEIITTSPASLDKTLSTMPTDDSSTTIGDTRSTSSVSLDTDTSFTLTSDFLSASTSTHSVMTTSAFLTTSLETTTSVTSNSTNTANSTTSGSSTTSRKVHSKITNVVAVFPVEKNEIDVEDSDVRNDILQQLSFFYIRLMGNKFKSITLLSVRIGSLIVSYNAEYENNTEASAAFARTTADLIAGEEKIAILNELVSATSVQINNNTVYTSAQGIDVCKLFLDTNGECEEGSECQDEERTPACVSKATTSGITVIIVAVTCSAAVVIIIPIIICGTVRAYTIRNRRSAAISTNISDETNENAWPSAINQIPASSFLGTDSAARTTGYPFYISNTTIEGFNFEHDLRYHHYHPHKIDSREKRFYEGYDGPVSSKRSCKTNVNLNDNRYHFAHLSA